MDWFLYDRDLHHERVKATKKVENKRSELIRITLYLDQKQKRLLELYSLFNGHLRYFYYYFKFGPSA